MRASESHARLCEYSMSLLREIEIETGQSTGFKQVGSLSVAHSEARFEELKRVAAMNNAFGITQVDMVTPSEAKVLYPSFKTQTTYSAPVGLPKMVPLARSMSPWPLSRARACAVHYVLKT